jgi:putative aldouronate transport system permease protein
MSSNSIGSNMTSDMAELMFSKQQLAAVIKYGVMIVSTLPIIVAYPFLQKYFVKGMMVGSVKG